MPGSTTSAGQPGSPPSKAAREPAPSRAQAFEVPARWVPSWGVAYGGYVASVLAGAIDRVRPVDHDPVQVHVTFLRPLRAGPAEVEVEPFSPGRRATAMAARLTQGGREVARASFWGAARAGGPSRRDLPPAAPGPEACPPMAVDGQATVPEFMGTEIHLRRIDETRQWVSAGRPFDLEALVLVSDLSGGRAFGLAEGRPTELASLDLTVHLLRPVQGEWLQCRSEVVAAVEGRCTTRATYWDEQGAVATMAQVALVREVPPSSEEHLPVDRPTGRSGIMGGAPGSPITSTEPTSTGEHI